MMTTDKQLSIATVLISQRKLIVFPGQQHDDDGQISIHDNGAHYPMNLVHSSASACKDL